MDPPRGRARRADELDFPGLQILLFAKSPVPGRVKTRLIPHLGAVRATRLYRAMLTEVLSNAADVGRVEIYAAPDARHPWMRRLADRFRARVHAQVRGDLGTRMAAAARRTLSDATAVLLIGADGVWLEPDTLRDAALRLYSGIEAVLVPAEDGGYVLLGLRRGFDSRLFGGMPWGMARVATLTRARLRGSGMRWEELPPLPDLDTPRDLRRWQQRGRKP